MFAPYCYPPAGSEAIVTCKLLLVMLDAGWEVDVISQSDFGHYYPTSVNGVWEPIRHVVHNMNGIEMGSIIGKFKFLTYLQSISWVKKAMRLARQLLSKKEYDVILSRATPQYGHLPALMLCRKFHIPWIANWSDPLPPQKAPPPYGQGPDAQIPFFLSGYCSAVARNATWHTFPCERLRKYACSYLKDIQNKSSVIPHIALERFLNSEQGENGGFSLCHIGSLTNRDPYIFMKGVKQFYEHGKISDPFNIRFIGLESTRLQNVVKSLKLNSIASREESKTYEETQIAQAKSTVLVLIEAPCEEGIFFPSKFTDYVQTGRPILAVSPETGTLADILSANGGGIAADCRSPDAVSKAIEILYNEWKTGTLNERYGSHNLFNLFSERYVLDQYLEIFKKF